MKKLFSGTVYSSFHELLICADGDERPNESGTHDQENGICGTAVKHQILLVLGPHSSAVHLDIHHAKSTPALDEDWEEIVEAPFVADQSLVLWMRNFDFDHQGSPIILSKGTYRMRFSATNYHDPERHPKGPQFHELIIWPHAYVKDKILKVTSDDAKYQHTAVQRSISRPDGQH